MSKPEGAHVCVLCNGLLESKEALQQHFRRHANREIDLKGRPLGPDGEVVKQTTSNGQYIKGSGSQVNTSILCDVCGLAFTCNTKAIQHKFKKHPLECAKHYCPQCGMQFPLQGHRDKHLKENHESDHVPRNPYPCYQCGAIFYNKAAHEYHDKSAHHRVVTLYKQIQTPPPSKKIRYNNAGEPQSVYYCHLCGLEYIVKFNLQKHLERQHPFEERAQQPPELYKCNTCDALFFNGKAYNNHNVYHRPNDIYVATEEQRLATITRVDQDFDIRRVQSPAEKYIPKFRRRRKPQNKIFVLKKKKESSDEEMSPPPNSDSDSEEEKLREKKKREAAEAAFRAQMMLDFEPPTSDASVTQDTTLKPDPSLETSLTPDSLAKSELSPTPDPSSTADLLVKSVPSPIPDSSPSADLLAKPDSPPILGSLVKPVTTSSGPLGTPATPISGTLVKPDTTAMSESLVSSVDTPTPSPLVKPDTTQIPDSLVKPLTTPIPDSLAIPDSISISDSLMVPGFTPSQVSSVNPGTVSVQTPSAMPDTMPIPDLMPSTVPTPGPSLRLAPSIGCLPLAITELDGLAPEPPTFTVPVGPLEPEMVACMEATSEKPVLQEL